MGACLKYLLFAANLIVWIIGVVLIGLAIWAIVDPKLKERFCGEKESNEEVYKEVCKYAENLKIGAYVLLAVGVVITIIGFLGCCGAIKEIQCMLCLYGIILLALAAAMIGGGAYAIAKKGKVKEDLQKIATKALEKDMELFGKKNKTFVLQLLEKDLKCCGATGPEDYTKPDRKRTPECAENMKGGNKPKGCVEALTEFAESRLKIIGGIALGLVVCLLIGSAMGFCLCCSIRNAESV